MSIPDRLWRIARGHWDLASERMAGAQAEADAYQELAEALRKPPPVSPTLAEPGVLPQAPQAPAGQVDPFAASYALLKVECGASLPALEAAYTARMAELKPEQYAAGSSERALVEGRRAAVEAAYQRLRDLLNPTETRFERLEF